MRALLAAFDGPEPRPATFALSNVQFETFLEPVILAQAAKPLLVLHALTAMALLGATTHLVIVKALRWRGRPKERLEALYSRLIAPLFVGAFILGLAMYPHFRVDVRARFLDSQQPWASNLFDFKEHMAALGLPLAVALFFLARRGPASRPVADLFAVVLWAIVAWAAISGLIITSVRGV